MSETAVVSAPITKFHDRVLGIDAARYLSVFAIIIIHSLAKRELSYDIGAEDVATQICRFAVPFFFMSGGFFLGRKNIDNVSRTVLRIIKRTVPLFLFWTAAYTFAFPKYIPSTIDLRYFIILLATGGSGYHLWFLPSYGLCLALVIIATRYLQWSWMFAIAFILYATGLLIGSYSGLVSSAAHATATGLSIARGGPFFGTIFVLFGLWLARSGWRASIGQSMSLILLGLALHLTEAYLLDVTHLSYFAANDFLVGTLPLGAGVFLLALNMPSSSPIIKSSAALGKYTLGVYASHLLFVLAFNSILLPTGLGEKLGMALAVLLTSTLLSVMLARIRFMRYLVT